MKTPPNSDQPTIDYLREIVAQLRAPDGCPWDREQTHTSLRSGLIEEAYEAVEAIDRSDDENLREELGDCLLQVVMHSQIAAEGKRFDFDQVALAISEKLLRRHPHVFGENSGGKNLANGEAVLRQWDEIKRTEKGKTETKNDSAVESVSPALPALMRAEKVQKKAARVGFDWENVRDVFGKIAEEIAEIEEAITVSEPKKIEEEMGDLLFSAVNLARRLSVDPEIALQKGTDKFIARFQKIEAALAQQNKTPQTSTLEEMDTLWNRVKTDKV